MNKAKLKTYAPQARKDFIAAVTQRANLLGLSESAGKFEALPAERRGDVVLIAGREWPARVAQQRDRLVRRIQRDGFAYTMEAVAYTWFNRFAALRYMELHDYLGHGHRVLSSATTGGLPDILAHAADLAASRELPGLDAAHIAELKLAGNKDGELYRLLLVAQCNALSAAMPFLFERIDDETELLLPDNLLRTDSVIAKLVAEIPEEDWAEVEIIGWLYQFYISEKKDQVIGKVVKSEDIPAATQLFTPNWIVQYLVQNSVGRLWLMANPTSTLKAEWPYYIEPAEQTPEVNAQLDALIQTRMAEDGGSLNPESITVLDPACGSGHILVEAYALLKGIYLERGYRLRDIPRLILEKNLYGLDIDDRAAQLAGFALLMKARADDRRLFNDPPRLNVLSLQESKGLELDELATHLAPFGLQRATIKALLDTFEHAKTFGSLIQIPDALNAQLPALAEAVGKANETGDLYAQAAAQDLLVLVEQAQVLGRKFDAVVANPPYMGARYYTTLMKQLVERDYAIGKGDLYTCFMVRNADFARIGGSIGMITIPNWMFISSFSGLREWLFRIAVLETFSHNGRGVFGSDFGSCAFTYRNFGCDEYRGTYKRLFDKQGSVSSNDELNGRFSSSPCFFASSDDFRKIAGAPVAYWISDDFRTAFSESRPIADVIDAKQGMATADNNRFLRRWFEVEFSNVCLDSENRLSSKESKRKWFPYNKGGEFRKWYGNHDFVVNWFDDGKELWDFRPRSVIRNPDYYFKACLSWSDITSATTCFRYTPKGFIHDVAGMSAFFRSEADLDILGYCNSNVVSWMVRTLNPTVHFQIGDFVRLPYKKVETADEIAGLVRNAISIAKEDWDTSELSWNFSGLNLARFRCKHVRASWDTWCQHTANLIEQLRWIEQRINRVYIDAYGLGDEVKPEVSAEQITLSRADREKDSQRLISYAIGCMMGRYSLDEPGLIYAHAGNVGFDSTRYKTFPADADGIVPITDEFWFEDDAANRVREFLRAVWGADTLDENMAWLAESLGTKAGETPDETIRRYLADKFFKDHLQTYKKRPIYWLFSSGKQGAFQALVYLHRYHEGTLARLRAEYVVPLTGKMQARIEMLEKDATAASSTAARNKLNKQIEKLRKKHVELLAYDEKLRHYADMRISLDLDDGVKVNYGKFGDLLAEVKAVTGGTGEE